jgi:7-cyano-7-deazaguanine synthase
VNWANVLYNVHMTDSSEIPKKALVLFSGGQDSTVCLAWALERFDQVETIGFDYGQRHHIEMECRTKVLEKLRSEFPEWAGKIGPDHLLDLSVLGKISDTALTSEASFALSENGLPNTFVPGRNLLFFTFAAAVAYRRGIDHLVGGMCETDFSGYPDCRNNALKSLESTLNLGMGKPYSIETPLMWLDKAATWNMARELGGEKLLSIIIEDTHTCYVGDRTHRHPWGYGCGTCDSCLLRAKGHENFSA